MTKKNVVPKKKVQVLHASAEYLGLAKTGGLADMVAALSIAQQAQGLDVCVCIPAYSGTALQLAQAKKIAAFTLHGLAFTVIEGRLVTHGPRIWLLDCPPLYDRGANPYRDSDNNDFTDNALRFGLFSEAVARLAQGMAGWKPDIVHLHDWHCALAAPWMCKQAPRAPIMFTIHNLAHQGLFDRATFDALGLPAQWWSIDGVEFYDQLSFMKAGLQFCDVITTVSPTYAREIQTPEYGCQLDGVLRYRNQALHGILNGIDDEHWNPATDTLIDCNFDPHTVAAGKLQNKKALCRELGLQHPELPLAIFIGRLADQKGADLILAARHQIRDMPLQFVLLGSGQHELEQQCLQWAREAPEQVRVLLKVDETIAHRLTAAADLQIMPSRFEPCGLNQMYAQRYGTIPIVRRTGGLADTVVEATPATLKNHTATGVLFDHADANAIVYALRRGIELISKPKARDALRANGMARDFSWVVSAQQYLQLYRAAMDRNVTTTD